LNKSVGGDESRLIHYDAPARTKASALGRFISKTVHCPQEFPAAPSPASQAPQHCRSRTFAFCEFCADADLAATIWQLRPGSNGEVFFS
jgi:hypothetical protein